MSALVVYCHPDERSHNNKILQSVLGGLKEAGVEYELLDLYESDFDPLMKSIEYERAFITRERVTEDDVKKLQEQITRAQDLIFIYPVWWYSMPAYLKGYMDRVYTAGFAYKFFRVPSLLLFFANIASFIPGVRYMMQTRSVTGLLKGKRAYIFRSFGGPKLGKRVFGNVPTSLENVVLRFCGITKIKIHELYNVNKSAYTEAYERAYLEKAKRIVSTISKS